MNILQNRIESFRNNSVKWPHGEKYHKIETFAKAGFYFVRRPKAADAVRCFLCDIDLSHWKQGQSPYSRHSLESPHCPWALLNFPESTARPWKVREDDPSTQPQHKSMISARLATFNNHNYWPPNKSTKSRRYQSATKLASAGFYFAPTLENSARVKCPYCKNTILEPKRNLDTLENHKELDSSCSFFQRSLSIRAKNRRDTATSTASNETFKTAASQLEEEVEAILKETSSQKRKADNNDTNEDDSIWDINKVLDIPTHIKKPTLTFAKKARQRPISSTSSRSNVDIFSNVTLKPSSISSYLTSLTEESEQLEQVEPTPSKSKPKPKPKQPRNSAKRSKPDTEIASSSPSAAKADELLLMSPTFPPPETSAKNQSLLSSKNNINKEYERNTEPEIVAQKSPTLPPKTNFNQEGAENDENTYPVLPRDKGKGRAVEFSIPPKKPISLSKNRKSISPSHTMPSSPTASSSPTRTRDSAVSASIAEQLKYLQSTPMTIITPMNSIHATVNVMDIFGYCPLSPISGSSGNAANDNIRTPGTTIVGRTRSLITEDGQRRSLQPHALKTTTLPPAMSIEADAAPLVTEEQKQMTVETYLQHIVDENISKVREQGDQLIALIKERSNAIKQDLLSQKE